VTGDQADPDQGLLQQVEAILEVKNAEEFRRNLMNLIAAHAIDHPGEAIDHVRIFPRHVEQVKEAYFIEHRAQIVTLIDDMLALLSDVGHPLQPEARAHAQQAFERLQAAGYCAKCARAALGELQKERYT
jgi:predicted Ser/Thr protein kinase